jgi:hypothetical protein
MIWGTRGRRCESCLPELSSTVAIRRQSEVRFHLSRVAPVISLMRHAKDVDTASGQPSPQRRREHPLPTR